MSHAYPPGDTAVVGRRLAALERRVIACRLCPRLVEHREHMGEVKRPRYAGWEYWSRPVPGFGDPSASLMVVGLAPADGANRTGRLFSGDLSAKFLMAALHQAGFANQPTSEHRGDGLELRDAYICAAVRCVPPGDRPTSEEQQACLPYLVSEIGILPRVRTILVLGHVAFQACLRALARIKGEPVKGTFAHGSWYHPGADLPRMVASYHPSPRNTNTGRLSKDEFVALLL
ncbi:MAG: uracil-DNA glycosylase, partial [Dehalococcoidia bacterium]|nr:uracil-DNA glycosylase [Dehalococcoidia bacterium]